MAPQMHNKPILITGCQRSGTTLLNLVLDSHPEIHGVDEMEYSETKLREYITAQEFHPQIAFKLPVYAPFLDWIKGLLPELRVLWLIRQPRDVVASMIATPLPLSQGSFVPWPSHPFGGVREILHCVSALPSKVIEGISPYIEHYSAIVKMPPAEWERSDMILAAALCWRVKNELPAVYKLNGIHFLTICYEQFVTFPRQEICKILEYLNLPWHDNMLHHNLLHKGILVGKTDASRPICTKSIGRWKGVFSMDELRLIDALTADLAKRFTDTYEASPSFDV